MWHVSARLCAGCAAEQAPHRFLDRSHFEVYYSTVKEIADTLHKKAASYSELDFPSNQDYHNDQCTLFYFSTEMLSNQEIKIAETQVLRCWWPLGT